MSQSRLNLTTVVSTALTLLNEDGLDALSLRAVAKRLGSHLNSVSWQVKTKARLFELMTDAILGELSSEHLPTTPRDRVFALAQRYREVLLAHRDGARLVAGTYVSEVNTLRIAELLISSLLEAGLSPSDATTTCWTVTYFTAGLVQEEQNAHTASPEALREAVFGGDYPGLAISIDSIVAENFDERFHVGLSRLLASMPA